MGWAPQETRIPKIKLPSTSRPGLASPSPLPPPEPQGSPLTPHMPTPPPHLTFPCISMRSVRVMLSSGSSSSPASEPLILSGGAGAEAAWEHVHTVAWPALRGQWERGQRGAPLSFRSPALTWGSQSQARQTSRAGRQRGPQVSSVTLTGVLCATHQLCKPGQHL